MRGKVPGRIPGVNCVGRRRQTRREQCQRDGILLADEERRLALPSPTRNSTRWALLHHADTFARNPPSRPASVARNSVLPPPKAISGGMRPTPPKRSAGSARRRCSAALGAACRFGRPGQVLSSVGLSEMDLRRGRRRDAQLLRERTVHFENDRCPASTSPRILFDLLTNASARATCPACRAGESCASACPVPNGECPTMSRTTPRRLGHVVPVSEAGSIDGLLDLRIVVAPLRGCVRRDEKCARVQAVARTWWSVRQHAHGSRGNPRRGARKRICRSERSPSKVAVSPNCRATSS